MALTIRKAQESDAELICELSKKTFIETFASVNTEEDMKKYIQENFTIEEVRRELNNADSLFFIAYSDEEAAAYMKLNVGTAQTEAQGEESMELQRIYVLKAHKGKHIGSQLIQVAEDEVAKREFSYLWLGVWEHNEAALGFYTHLGFKRFSEHIFTLGEDAQTDFLLRKQIHK